MNKVKTECSKSAVDCHASASVTLAGCGHEVTWLCGSDEDPRLNPTGCQPCIYPKWIDLINKNEFSLEANETLITKSLSEIKKCLSSYCKQAEFTILDRNTDEFISNLENHTKCRPNVVRRYFEYARNADIQLPIPKKDSLTDLAHYDLVFFQVKNDSAFENSKFEQMPTRYGRGYELTKLSEISLSKCKINSNGLVRVLVGAAFRFNNLAYSQPFCSAVNKKGNYFELSINYTQF